MNSIVLLFFAFAATLTSAQFPGNGGGNSPWGSMGQQGPKQPGPYHRPPPNYKNNMPPSYSDDPIPPQSFDSSYDAQTLPSKLPIQAPNGVIEIYNRVIDDLIKRLESDFQKRSLDPMDVVIRPTPPGPVRVPGHLQKRPFRRPGAALYRTAAATTSNVGVIGTSLRPQRKSRDDQPRFPDSRPEVNERPSFRGAGKITILQAEVVNSSGETTPTPEQVVSSESTEIDSFLQARSDELFQDEEERESRKDKKKKEDTEEEEADDDFEPPSNKKTNTKDVSDLIQKYQNTNAAASTKEKYTGGKKVKPTAPTEPKKQVTVDPEDEDDEESQDDYHEPGTLQGAGDRPQGGYYPQSGPPAVPAKPNAQLIGLSRIRRSSDVSVSVDARSAVITARLLVGPLDVIINDSVEPQERNIKATIPELEAELLLMERHGVVFLQRFTLDRAYGQDVEISIPKSKSNSDKKSGKGSKKGSPVQPTGGFPQPSHPDPNHPSNVQQRFQTKMAAHISMEIVKLLRSGNLRVNLMRVAQGSMSKLKLPIQKKKKENGKKKIESAKEDE